MIFEERFPRSSLFDNPNGVDQSKGISAIEKNEGRKSNSNVTLTRREIALRSDWIHSNRLIGRYLQRVCRYMHDRLSSSSHSRRRRNSMRNIQFKRVKVTSVIRWHSIDAALLFAKGNARTWRARKEPRSSVTESVYDCVRPCTTEYAPYYGRIFT